MAIIALRLGGLDDDKIAELRGISRKSIAGYIYRAGKNGWLSFNNSREAIENGMAHKVIRNLDELLEARDKETTLEVAKGTIFKDFGAAGIEAPVANQYLSIRIEQPREQQAMRPGTLSSIIDVTPEAPRALPD